MARTINDLTGRKFGRLKVIEFLERKKGHTFWKCECSCGNTTITTTNSLIANETRSCGCLMREGNNKKHMHSNTRLYHIWRNMKQRCYYPQSPSYKNYGEKGIAICEKWLNDFESFFEWSMKNGYKEDLTIDRINNDKGYSPRNCRWVTRKQQNYNTSRNRYISFEGETLALGQWAEKQNINKNTLKNRLDNKWSPWSIEKALTVPARKYKI